MSDKVEGQEDQEEEDQEEEWDPECAMCNASVRVDDDCEFEKGEVCNRCIYDQRDELRSLLRHYYKAAERNSANMCTCYKRLPKGQYSIIHGDDCEEKRAEAFLEEK